MAMGCRLIRLGARIDRSFVRHIISRTFATMASRVLGIKVYDTQNGAKLIKSNIVKELFEDEFITRWLFDIELIFRLIKKIGKNEAKRLIVEVPLNECRDIDGSKIKTMDFIRAPLELFKIWRKYG